MQPHLDIAIVTDGKGFRALEEEWEDLYRSSPLSTPFQSWSFLYSWWESFGEGDGLRIITVRDKGFLVGLIPLKLQRRWGFFRRLLFIGRGNQMDLLARKEWDDQVCETGVEALRQIIGSWHVIDLKALSPTAAAWGIFRQWKGYRARIPLAHYLFIEVNPLKGLLASLSRKHRNTVRRSLRRAERDGVHSVRARPEEAERAAHMLVALHRELRRGRRISRRHLTPEFESFVVAAARRMTDRGLGGISELWRDGELLMSSFTFFGHKITYAYLVGVHQEAGQRYQWSSLGIWDVLSMASGRNSDYVCLGDGRDPYKLRWSPKEVPYYQITMGRGLFFWGLYSAAYYASSCTRAGQWLRRRLLTRISGKGNT
jgi:CelD/BcsL family acetyltransferase involved in cellulose biosynthesis